MKSSSLEAVLEDTGDVVRLAHCVEVDGWDAVGDEVLALHRAPFCTDLIDRGFIVSGLCYFLCEFDRDV